MLMMADNEREQHLSEVPTDILCYPNPATPESGPSREVSSDQHSFQKIDIEQKILHYDEASSPSGSNRDLTRLTIEPLERLKKPIEDYSPNKLHGPNSDDEDKISSKVGTDRCAKPPLPLRTPNKKELSNEQLCKSSENHQEYSHGQPTKASKSVCCAYMPENSGLTQIKPSVPNISTTKNQKFPLKHDDSESLLNPTKISGPGITEENLETDFAETKKLTSKLNDQEKSRSNESTSLIQHKIPQNSTKIDPECHMNDQNLTTDRDDYDKYASEIPAQYRDTLIENITSLPRSTSHLPNSSPRLEHENFKSDNRKQRKEKYDIKRIKWCDQNSIGEHRVSPILIQNANGPCPLLALVNALTLSTPANLSTPLVDTLRSREQISLGLLLDAVFDELTSERRSNTTNELPDVTDLYSFLVTLHTGMNVNPCFFPRGECSFDGQPTSPEKLIGESGTIPGSFEETREMLLYSTFKIPLIHGWLPHPHSPEYGALFRSAKTYEDAQNKMLMQDSLEAKQREGSLDLREQTLLEDIITIKSFINSNATQLTFQGLDIITRSIPPGSVAIFFRNNHFSTLYRHYENCQLLQLVTDIGYAKNDSVIWESLVDVNGENAQFFSGDFRLLSGNSNTQASTSQNHSRDLGSHTALKSTAFDSSKDNESASTQTHCMEQEDQDLALAFQIQEEEEQSHRAAMYQRRLASNRSQKRETRADRSDSEISRSVTSHRPSITSRTIPEVRPAIPPRRSIMNVGTQPHSGVADLDIVADLPPPSYEVAATQQAYVPKNPLHPIDMTSNHVYDSDIGSTDHGNHRNSEPSQRVDRRQRQSEQTVSHGTGLKRDKRLSSVQGVMDKMSSGQERVQKECAIM